MQYKVEVSDLANQQYDKFLNYIYNVLLLVYRIKDKTVIIEGMYHELQDYENAIG